MFQEYMQQSTYEHYVHEKLLYPKYFYCLLDFQCAKYGISLLQKRSFENLHGMIGRNFLILSFSPSI